MRIVAGLPFVIAAALLLAACSKGQEDGVGGVTADEAAQLHNAAEMLDTSPDSLAAPEDADGNAVADNDDDTSNAQ